MYMNCLAKEFAPHMIRLLNYAPGPLETDMVTEIRAAPGLDPSLQPSYAQPQLDPLVSARVLVQLVTKDSFTSGAHVDYFEVATLSGNENEDK